mgnify:CR=1 FL=1
MRETRRPKIGDLVMVLTDGSRDEKILENPCVGIVYKLNFDSWGHEKALIEWTNDQYPKDYRSTGYSGVNIHNLRRKFKIFRNGEEIK